MTTVPDKIYYKIGEVCEICQIEPHVLRYWETEFALLSPAKNKAGQRIYRHKDLQIVQTIKQLLYDEGYTIAGANKRLKELGPADAAEGPAGALSSADRQALKEARRELEAALQILSRTP